MNSVVDAGMQRMPATKSAAVGGIDDGINLQLGDVALPEIFFHLNDTFVRQLCLQLGILRPKKLVAQRLWLPYITFGDVTASRHSKRVCYALDFRNVHERPQQPLLVSQFGWNVGLSVVLLQQVADAIIDVLNSVQGISLGR